MDQQIANRMVDMATKYALAGNPVEYITWIPPQTGSQDPMGMFCIKTYDNLSGSILPPWEKY